VLEASSIQSLFKILGAGSKFHTENPQTLGATIQNLVAKMTWNNGFLHPRLINKAVSQVEDREYNGKADSE
jgi:hypothetical protein